jgi:HEAT repeat protein
LNIWGPAACGLCAALAIMPPTVAGAVHTPESVESADRTIDRLTEENSQLRQRLVSARRDFYNALPSASRAAELQSLLTDSLSDLKLLGIALAESFVTTQTEIPEGLTQAMADTVADADPQVRRAAAGLQGLLDDEAAVALLETRLATERVSDVRVGLLNALGRQRAVSSFKAVLARVSAKHNDEAQAAAGAVAKLAKDRKLPEALKTRATTRLMRRYQLASKSDDSLVPLREALLTALRVVGDPRSAELFRTGLTDISAAIRQASLAGLATQGRPEAARALVPRLKDIDRGVRQAAVMWLSKIGGPAEAKAVLLRTNPKVESDATIRKAAAEAVIAMCETAKSPALKTVIAATRKQPDTCAIRASLLQLLLKQMPAKDLERHGVLGQLAIEFMSMNQPEEAARVLAEAIELTAPGPNENPSLQQLTRYRAHLLLQLEALLRAEDPAAVATLMKLPTGNASPSFADGWKLVQDHLTRWMTEKKYGDVITMASRAAEDAQKRLDETQKKFLSDILAKAAAAQKLGDAKQVATLLVNLLGAEEKPRTEAKRDLVSMGVRSREFLLAALKTQAQSDPQNAAHETAIYEILQQIDPTLEGYDVNADAKVRLDTINKWLGISPAVSN